MPFDLTIRSAIRNQLFSGLASRAGGRRPGSPPDWKASRAMKSPRIRLRIKAAEARIQNVRLRMPFRFGLATLTETPKLTVRVIAEDEAGRSAFGLSSDVLPALWFDKAPGKTIDEKIRGQITGAQLALAEYEHLGAGFVEPFALWLEAYGSVHAKLAALGINELTASFASSFAERAMMDAACRLAGVSFFEALKTNRFGIDPGLVHAELTAEDYARAIPDAPLDKIYVRHTVGLGDAPLASEIAPENRLNDGLPQALEDDLAVYGHRYFKIKIDADRDRNLARLRGMARLFAKSVEGDYHVTLDGNEQVEKLDDVRWLLAELGRDAAGARLVRSILFVEQPLPRDKALDPAQAAAIRDFADIAPLVIDESDSNVDSLLRAREIGWSGISVKNCKGVFKAILNKTLIAKWNASGDRPVGGGNGGAAREWILSSEDLTNLGVVALQQDFATAAALGITHSERNGHHYFRGLVNLDDAERASALREHPDVYEVKGDATVLRIRDGAVRIGSIQQPGYGYHSEINFERRARIEDWTPEATA